MEINFQFSSYSRLSVICYLLSVKRNFQFSISNFRLFQERLLILFLLFTVFCLFSANNLFSLSKDETGSSAKIKLGIDVLIESDFEILKDKKILLLTNNTGRTSNGELSVNAFLNTSRCKIIGLLTPEHGFFTTVPAGEHVSNDKIFGLPTYSLYGSSRKPSQSVLKECTAVVIDIQDIGIRSYTYISTIFKTMQACLQNNLPVFVLDRPNPLGGEIVDGNIVEKGRESFVGIAPISYIHGCTIGELAEMFNNEGWLSGKNSAAKTKCNLTVIKMENWHRSMEFEETGLNWYPTSPHIPTVNSIRGAALLGAFGELGIISIGIGTTLPFQYIGSPEFNTESVIKEINKIIFAGIQFNPIEYQPFYGMYSGKQCNGLFLTFFKDKNFRPYTSGIIIFSILANIYPNLFSKDKLKDNSVEMFNKVTGTEEILKALINKKSNDELRKLTNKGYEEYKKIRQKYLLY